MSQLEITRRAALGTALAGMAAAGGRRARADGLTKVTYAVATADLNAGYPFATLPKALGYFEQEGLDVTVVPGQSSVTVIQLLLTGRADVGVAQPEPMMIQRATNKVPLVSFYVVSRRGTNVFVVTPDSPIHSIADMKGKKIGVSDLGSGGVIYLRARLKAAGMSINDVQLISVGYGTPAFEALKNHAVDTEVTFTGGVAREKLAGYDVRILPPADYERDWYSYNLLATQKYVDANPKVIAGIGRATARATVFLMTNPEAAVHIFWNQYPDRAPKDRNDPKAFASDLAIIKAQLRDMAADELPTGFAWGSQDPAIYAKMQANLVDGGQIASPVDPALFFTNAAAKTYIDFDHDAVIKAAKAAQ
jgi:NitT/TauT family transport system substrate-binding protein